MRALKIYCQWHCHNTGEICYQIYEKLKIKDLNHITKYRFLTIIAKLSQSQAPAPAPAELAFF